MYPGYVFFFFFQLKVVTFFFCFFFFSLPFFFSFFVLLSVTFQPKKNKLLKIKSFLVNAMIWEKPPCLRAWFFWEFVSQFILDQENEKKKNIHFHVKLQDMVRKILIFLHFVQTRISVELVNHCFLVEKDF